jgi:hypothetical protein
MLHVHLYFVKLFGCLIKQESIPIDLRPFSQAIINGQPHPNVWLALWANKTHQPVRHVGQSQVETAQLYGQIVYATWFYFVERAAINVLYAEPTERRKGLVYAWHPTSVGKRIHVAHEA